MVILGKRPKRQENRWQGTAFLALDNTTAVFRLQYTRVYLRDLTPEIKQFHYADCDGDAKHPHPQFAYVWG